MANRMISVEKLDDVTELLDDITKCPICRESYKDPRSLPCIHTLCFSCISKWGGGSKSGNSFECPLCRKKFTISANGFKELPKNFFIEKLVAMKETPSPAPNAQLCGCMCAAADIKNEGRKLCVECQVSLCESCIDTHSKLKQCRPHQTLHIEEVPDASTVCLPTRCDKHPDEELKLFCIVCKEALCLICYATKHSGHHSAEIKDVADKFRREIGENISQLAGGVKCLAESLSKFQTARQEIVNKSAKVEAEICSRAEQLKLAVENHKQQLIAELNELKVERLNQLDTLVQEITLNKVFVYSLKKYSEELLKKGSDEDIAREIELMNLRVAEMKHFYDCDRATATNDTFVTFVPSQTTLDTSCNQIGKLKSAASGIGRNVEAMTSSNNQRFVTRHTDEGGELRLVQVETTASHETSRRWSTTRRFGHVFS